MSWLLFYSCSILFVQRKYKKWFDPWEIIAHTNSKMLANYYGNSSMLSIYIFFVKSHDRKELSSSKILDKCKKSVSKGNFRKSWKILQGQPQKFIGWTRPFVFLWPHLHQPCFVSHFTGRNVGLTHLNIFRTARATLMNFCSVNTPICQIFVSGCKVFWLFPSFDHENKSAQKMECIVK